MDGGLSQGVDIDVYSHSRSGLGLGLGWGFEVLGFKIGIRDHRIDQLNYMQDSQLAMLHDA